MLIDDVWITAEMIPELSNITGCHRTTVARWIAQRRLPPIIHRYLRLRLQGRLGELHPAWSGWSMDTASGEIWSPENLHISAPEIRALPYRYHLDAIREDSTAETARKWPALAVVR